MKQIHVLAGGIAVAAVLFVLPAFSTPAHAQGRPDVPSTAGPHPATDANSTLLEKYVFSAGTGDTVTGAPGYDDPAKIVGCEWTKPGYKNAAGALRFDGKASITWLPVTKTPNGPVSIKGVIRPNVLGGLWFSDVGGLILAIQANGTLSAQRHTSDAPWTFIQSTVTITTGDWTVVEYQWDGATQRLFVNGQLAAEGPCSGGFVSGPRALGCNCYGSTSDHFAGDIASLEVRTLKVPK